jgi:hypothetical protein
MTTLDEAGFEAPQIAAARVCLEVTEAVCRRFLPDEAAPVAAARAFFRDSHVGLAFRKRLARWVEDVLRVYFRALSMAEPGTEVLFVPEDQDGADLVRAIPPDVLTGIDGHDRTRVVAGGWFSATGALRVLGMRALTAVLPLAVAGRLAWRQGVAWRRPSRRPYKVGVQNVWGLTRSEQRFRHDLFCIDGQRIAARDLLVVLKRPTPGRDAVAEYRAAGVDAVDPAALRVPVGYLLRDLLPRLIAFAARGVFGPIRPMEGYFARTAISFASLGGSWEVLLQHVSLRVLCSIEEHSPPHVVETMVLNRHGGRTVWLPHTQLLRGGYPTAYFHYDVMCAGGAFLHEAYGSTWSSGISVRPVGLASNDDAALPAERLAAPKVIEFIRTLAGRPIVAVFPGSYVAGRSTARYAHFLEALVSILRARPDAHVVIKPKGPRQVDFLYEEPLHDIIHGAMTEGQLTILNPKNGEACSAQYLAREATVVLSTTGWNAPIGSAWVEALMLGKPSFAYNPGPFYELPLLDEFYGSLIFDREDKLAQMVVDVLDRGWSFPLTERQRRLFDPFCDHRAVDRIVDEIAAMAEGVR